MHLEVDQKYYLRQKWRNGLVPPVLDSLDNYKIEGTQWKNERANYLSSLGELKFRVDQPGTGISCTSMIHYVPYSKVYMTSPSQLCIYWVCIYDTCISYYILSLYFVTLFCLSCLSGVTQKVSNLNIFSLMLRLLHTFSFDKKFHHSKLIYLSLPLHYHQVDRQQHKTQSRKQSWMQKHDPPKKHN